jgi:hypothetical protein
MHVHLSYYIFYRTRRSRYVLAEKTSVLSFFSPTPLPLIPLSYYSNLAFLLPIERDLETHCPRIRPTVVTSYRLPLSRSTLSISRSTSPSVRTPPLRALAFFLKPAVNLSAMLSSPAAPLLRRLCR